MSKKRKSVPPVRDHIAGIPDDEHLAYFSLCEPGWQHPGVNAGHEDGCRCRVVPDSLELLQHVPLLVCPVPHNPMQDLADTQCSPARRHDLKYYSPVISSLC